MANYQLKKFSSLFLIFYFFCFVNSALSQPKYAISMYDSPKLPHDFVSLPYSNPNAKKGGILKIGAVGSVNLEALAESEELTERLAGLESQLVDVTDGKHSVEKLI